MNIVLSLIFNFCEDFMKLINFIFIFLIFSCSNFKGKIPHRSFKDQLSNTSSFGEINNYGFHQLCSKSFNQGYFPEAKRVLHQFKENPQFWFTLSNCYFENGEYQKAEFYLLEALFFSKDNLLMQSKIFNNLAIIRIRFKDFLAAKDFLLKSLNSHSSNHLGIYNLAYLSFILGDIKSCLNYLFLLRNKNISHSEIDFLFAKCFFINKDFQKSFITFNQLPQDYFRKKDFQHFYYLLLLKLKSKDAAIEFVSKFPLDYQKLNNFLNFFYDFDLS
jgi:tetratricopeptide (TPR) repeat protein